MLGIHFLDYQQYIELVIVKFKRKNLFQVNDFPGIG